ncbi:MAG TPA: DinB family protein [Candidatus Eisenbacteria bacterium]|nr:DinB family protein [Candidatus Eisenbacteria bacterium]
MSDLLFARLKEILRETFEGALPGEGTEYLDHASGIRATLAPLSARQASQRFDGHPSIAAHARHMAFHLRVTAEWVQGVREKRDWLGSFEPQTVDEREWKAIQTDLESARAEFLAAMESLGPKLAEEGAGLGAIAHLAYHLGAIRQLLHRV